MTDKKTPEDVRKELLLKTKAYNEVFVTTEAGRQILADLRSQYNEIDCARLGESDHDTVVRSARRDVIDYIHQMIRVGGQTDD